MNENNMDYVSETDVNADVTEQKTGSGLAIAAFVCGIISIVGLGWIGPTIWVAIICGIVGRSKYPSYTSEYKKCKWGMILGIIAFALGVIQGIILGLLITLGPVIYLNS